MVKEVTAPEVEDQIIAKLLDALSSNTKVYNTAKEREQYIWELLEPERFEYTHPRFKESYTHNKKTLIATVKRILYDNCKMTETFTASGEGGIYRLFTHGAGVVLKDTQVTKISNAARWRTPAVPSTQTGDQGPDASKGGPGKKKQQKSPSPKLSPQRVEKIGGHSLRRRKENITSQNGSAVPTNCSSAPARQTVKQDDPQQPTGKTRGHMKQREPHQHPDIAQGEHDIGARTRQEKRAAHDEEEQRPPKGVKRQKTGTVETEVDQPMHTRKPGKPTKPRQNGKSGATAQQSMSISIPNSGAALNEVLQHESFLDEQEAEWDPAPVADGKRSTAARGNTPQETSHQPSGNLVDDLGPEEDLYNSTPRPESVTRRMSEYVATQGKTNADHDEDMPEPDEYHSGDNTWASFAKNDSRLPRLLDDTDYNILLDRPDEWSLANPLLQLDESIKEAVSIVFPPLPDGEEFKVSFFQFNPSPQLAALYRRALGPEWLPAGCCLAEFFLPKAPDFLHCLIWSFLIAHVLQEESMPWLSAHELCKTQSVHMRYLVPQLNFQPGRFKRLCRKATESMLSDADFRKAEMLPAASVAADKLLLTLVEHLEAASISQLPKQETIEQFRLVCENALILLAMLKVSEQKVKICWYDSTYHFDESCMEDVGEDWGPRVAFAMRPGLFDTVDREYLSKSSVVLRNRDGAYDGEAEQRQEREQRWSGNGA